MSSLRERLKKLEAMTEARGATPAEAAQARELAAKLRQKLQAETPWQSYSSTIHSDWSFLNVDIAAAFERRDTEDMEKYWQALKQSGRRVVSPAWDPSLQGKVFK